VEEVNYKKTKRGRQWKAGASSTMLTLLPSDKQDGKASITERVHSEIRHAILSDTFSPGSWLRQDLLTEQLGVSRTPVREALRTLSREGLVEFIPNYGARVSELSMDEFEEIYAIRKGMEGLAARRSVRKLSFEKLEELRFEYIALADLAKEENLRTYLQEEWSFRLNLYRVGSSPRFIAQIQVYRELAERYLRYAYTFKDSINASYGLHRELLEACDQGDAARAEIIVQKALNWTLETAGPLIAHKL
jgi:DNA-binding GntR family transcriptional regulator